MKLGISVLALGIVGAALVGCSAEPSGTSDNELTGHVSGALDALNGTVAEATFYTGSEGWCGSEVVFVTVSQLKVSTPEQFYEDATDNVIEMIQSIKLDSDYEGFGFDYKATMPGLVDTYGNATDTDVLWLCYTSNDVEKINLNNATYARANILRMNTFGQDDVDKVFR